MNEQLTLELPAVDWLPGSPQTAQEAPGTAQVESVSVRSPQAHRAAPDNSEQWYQCYTLGHDETEAGEIFAERFGYPPAEIFEEYGILWLGPVK